MISGFALYPAGFIGAGLLLLRISVSGSLIALSAFSAPDLDWLQFLSVLMAVGLCAGLQTRVLAGLSLAMPVLWLAGAAVFSPVVAIHTADAFVLALTGPGRWSVDAVVFGRRTVLLPNRDDTIV